MKKCWDEGSCPNTKEIRSVMHLEKETVTVNHLREGEENEPTIETRIGDKRVQWLLDSGAKVTCIDLSWGIDFSQFPEQEVSVNLQGADGSPLEIVKCVSLPIKIRGRTLRQRVFVIPHLASRALLGYDFMKKHRVGMLAQEKSCQVVFGRELLNSIREGAEREVVATETLTVPAGYQAKLLCQARFANTEGLFTSERGHF